MGISIKLNQALEYDFLDYVSGNTFAFYIDFFQDDKGLIPMDLTGSDFVMDIRREDGCCCFRDQIKETLSIGDGLSLSIPAGGTILNRFNISKILESTMGRYNQSITWTDSVGKVFTCEKGKLKIEAKT